MSRSKAEPPAKSKSSASEAAWTQAVRWLAARDRSVAEVRHRLERAGVDAQTIETTVQRLRDHAYVDDERFAHGYAAISARRGHGSERARAELEQRGVAPALIDAAVATAFADEQQLAERALRRYQRGPLRSANERAKAARFLLNRGFPETVVLAIVGEGC